jgi:hypothetical protein
MIASKFRAGTKVDHPRVEWDQEVNAASIRFREIVAGEISANRPVQNDDGDVVAVLRFSSSGELLEVELLDAENQIPQNLPIKVITKRRDS